MLPEQVMTRVSEREEEKKRRESTRAATHSAVGSRRLRSDSSNYSNLSKTYFYIL